MLERSGLIAEIGGSPKNEGYEKHGVFRGFHDVRGCLLLKYNYLSLA